MNDNNINEEIRLRENIEGLIVAMESKAEKNEMIAPVVLANYHK